MLKKETPINKRILGLDPGFARTGFAILDSDRGRLRAIDYGCWETKKNEPFSQRLVFLASELRKTIKKFKPTLVAVEELFFLKNLKTAVNVAQARGVLLLVAEQAKTAIIELTPLEVKQSLSGYGRADKQQVQKMVQWILKLKERPQPDDVADALAVAIAAGGYFTSHISKYSLKTAR